MPVTERDVRNALKTVKDPELNLDLVVLGLVYDIDVAEDGAVHVVISLTSPGCPVAGQILEDARTAALGVEGVEKVEVELTFDPPWTPERISPADPLFARDLSADLWRGRRAARTSVDQLNLFEEITKGIGHGDRPFGYRPRQCLAFRDVPAGQVPDHGLTQAGVRAGCGLMVFRVPCAHALLEDREL